MNAIRLKEKKRLPLWFRILTDLLIVALISGVFAVYYLLLPKKADSMGTLEGLDQVRSFALPADPLATDLPERLSADADFDRVRKFRFAGLAAILQQDQRLRPEQ